MSSGVCELHNKKLKFACSTCKFKLICSKCIQSTHNGHSIGEQQTIFTNRLDQLNRLIEAKWGVLRGALASCESTDKVEGDIRQYFAELQQFIKQEEDRAIEFISQERESLDQNLKSLYNSISNLNSVKLHIQSKLSSTTAPNPTNNPNSLIPFENTRALLKQIESVDALDKFLAVNDNKEFDSSAVVDDLGDSGLDSPASALPLGIRLKLSQETVNRIKEDVGKSYELLGAEEQLSRSSQNTPLNILSIYAFVDYKPGFYALHSLDVAEKKWVAHHPTSEPFHKLLVVGGYICAFDGKRGVFKFDHINKNWVQAVYFEKQERFGPDSSFCSDGLRKVYIIGGKYGEHSIIWKYRSENTVVEYDVATNIFTEKGQLRWPRFNAHSILDGDNIYIIDSSDDKPSIASIILFSLESGSSKIVFKGKLDSKIESVCYDSVNRHIYIICKYSFYRWCISSYKLEKLVLFYPATTIFYGNHNGRAKIFAFGIDTKVNDFKCYDIKNNEWETYAHRDSLDFIGKAVPVYSSNISTWTIEEDETAESPATNPPAIDSKLSTSSNQLTPPPTSTTPPSPKPETTASTATTAPTQQ